MTWISIICVKIMATYGRTLCPEISHPLDRRTGRSFRQPQEKLSLTNGTGVPRLEPTIHVAHGRQLNRRRCRTNAKSRQQRSRNRICQPPLFKNRFEERTNRARVHGRAMGGRPLPSIPCRPTVSIFDGAGRIPFMSTIIPRNSWADAAKLHLAKFTDRPAVFSFPNTLCMVSRCSSQVVLVMRMSSSQLTTDSSSIGAGAVLTQNHGSREVVIAYASHRFSRTDSKRGPTERECMAVLWGVGHCRQFLAGRRFPFLTGLGVSRLCQPLYLGILGPTLQSYIWRSLPIGRPFLVFRILCVWCRGVPPK